MSELCSKIHISSGIGEYEFSMKGNRKSVLKKLRSLLKDGGPPFIVLETQTSDYVFPKEWLLQNAIITISEIDGKFNGIDVIEEASKIINSAFKNRGNKH